MHWPAAAVGHSKMSTSPLAGVVLVGVKVWLIVQVPGPAKPPAAALQLPNWKPNGGLRPLMPPADSTVQPASTVIVEDSVFVVLTGIVP